MKMISVYLLIGVFLFCSLLFPMGTYALDNLAGYDITRDVSENYGFYLNNLGYYKVDFESYWLNLREAVLRFQADNNLVADGIFGPNTLNSLINRLMKLDIHEVKYNDILSNYPTEDNWITINLTTMVLTMYKGKTAINKYPVAIGTYKNPTPTGKFSIVIKQVNPYWGGRYGKVAPVAGGDPSNPLGKRWMGLSIGGGGDYGIHGNAAPYSIGNSISNGCVRMFNNDVENLFEEVGLGTPVWIGQSGTLENYGVIQ